jgi:outer membrane protein assembly factor BamB
MLTAGAKAAYSYDPLTGKELWKVTYQGYSGAVTPLFGNNIAYFATGFGRTELLAVRPNGAGDVTETHIKWRIRSNVPRTPSSVLVNDVIFAITDNGIATCTDALTGEEVWKERLKGNYAASLLHADNKIYAFSREGTTTLFEPARTYKHLATNKLDEGFMASAAVHNDALYLRTKTHLYKIR